LPGQSTQTKNALIIVNVLARDGAADLETAREKLRQGRIASELVILENASHLKRIIRGRSHDMDLIIIGGGDGTLNAAVEPVLSTGLPLGILPLGTANDLARTLQIPPEMDGAVRVILQGRIKKIDLGWVNHKHFLNVAHIGLAARLSRNLPRSKKKRWGALAYPLSIWEAYRSTRPFGAQITCDGRKRWLRSIQIAVGNGRHYGGGMTIREDAAIDDQCLNLYSIDPQPAWRLLLAAPSIFRGTLSNNDPIHRMDGREIRITTGRRMPIVTDGEITTTTPALFTVKDELLPVFVP
jgi:diacylglycerol kinase (ATP)